MKYDSLHVPYIQILPYMIHQGWVTPKAFPPPITPYPPNFDANTKYEYHGGTPDHTTDNSKALKYKVQELINSKLLTFKEMGPNVKNNLLHGYSGPSVNAIEEIGEIVIIKEVEKVKTHMLIIVRS